MSSSRENNHKPAIVLGCHKVGLGVIRALGEKRVPVVAISYNKLDMGQASKYVIEHYWCQHPDTDPEGFISMIQDLGGKWNGSVLIPSEDATLIPISKHKKTLASSFRVVAADWDVVEQCVVKKHTYALAERIGVPCPKTEMFSNFDDARSFAREIGFPCLLKPTIGHRFFERFRKKMLFVRNLWELETCWSDYINKAGIEIMLQEYIPGDDSSGVNYNSFSLNGKPLIGITAQKIRLSPPRIGFPRVVVNKRFSELSAPANKLLGGLGYDGFSCIEFKKDARDGVYRLMEINARLNLSTPLSVKAGVNFPYLYYRYVLHGEVPREVEGSNEEIYWIDSGKDLVESVRSYRKERFSLAEYLNPYIKPNVFSVIAVSDMAPFKRRCIVLAKEAIRRITDKFTSLLSGEKTGPIIKIFAGGIGLLLCVILNLYCLGND